MSNGNVVDSKIVELGLNNQQFESNAKTSISTLDKLKSALNFSGSSKNFEDMNKSLHKIDVKSLSAGVGTLRDSLNSLKNVVVFSWIADEAIKAKNAVEGFIKSVTIDQVAAGFDKYANKTSAVQTIMSATASAYSDTEEQMADVNAQLEKLNWFTDETSFNFLDMVNNIGKFTSNNIGLKESITAMQGISTWAAKSGAGIGEAGRAMYNLSQAVATGTVKLMDWKSIENANMATAEFKQTAIETAESLNLLTKESDNTWKTLAGHEVSVSNFNQALSDGWFTSDVLLKTLDNYGSFTNQLYESISMLNDEFIASDMLTFIEEYKDGSLDLNEAVKGTSVTTAALKAELDKLSTTEMEFGLKAFKAAQEAKTFEEAVDSVKDAVSTGWMNTFEIMFGDYLEAKELWTTLANDLYDIFAEGGNARNELLKETFETQTAVTQADLNLLQKSGIISPEFTAAVRRSAQQHGVAMAKLVSDEEWYQTVLERGQLTMEDLNNAYKEVYGSSLPDVDQALLEQVKTAAETDESFKSLLDTVDKYNAEQLKEIKFGDGEYAEGLEELEGSLDGIIKSLGLTQEEGQALVDVLIAMKDGGKVTAKQIREMSDADLAAIGYSEDVIAQLRELQAQGKLTNESVMEVINAQHKTGGQLWTESLYNGLEALMNIVEVVRESFRDIFPPTDSGTLFNFLQWLNEATAGFAESIKTSEPFKAALNGIFSAADLVLRALGAVAKIAKNAFTSALSIFGINIGDIATKAGNAVTNFRNWAVENEVFSKTVTFVSNAISGALKWVKGLIDQFMSLPIVSKNIARFRAGFRLAFHSMPAFMKGLGEHFKTFQERIEKLGKFKLENLPEMFKIFKEEILDFITNFTGFKGIKSAFEHLGEDIGGVLDDVKAKIVTALEDWRKTLDNDSFAAKLYDFIFGAYDKIKAKLESNGGNVFAAVKDSIVDGLTNWRGTLDDSSIVAKIYDFIAGVFGKVTGELDKIAKNGDKSIFGKVFGAIINGIKGLLGILSSISLGKLAGAAAILGPIIIAVKVISKIWQLLKFVLHPLKSIQEVVDNVKGITESIKDRLGGKTNTFDKIIKIVRSVALMLFAIAVSLYIISSIQEDKLKNAVIALAVVAAVVVAVIGAIALINKFTGSSGLFGNSGGITKEMSKAIISTAEAIFIMAWALSNISKIPEDRLWSSVGAMAALGAILVAMQAALGYLNKKKMKMQKGAGKEMILSAIALFALAEVLAKIATIPADRLWESVGVMAILAVILAAMQAVNGYLNGHKMKPAGAKNMIATALSLYILAFALEKIAKIQPNRLKRAVKVMAVLALILAGVQVALGLISKFGGKTSLRQAIGMIATAAALGMMADTLAKLANIPADKLGDAEKAMAVMAGILAGMELVLGLLNKFDAEPSFGQDVAMLATAKALDMMAGTMAKLADIPTENLGDAELAISILAGLLTAMETILGIANGLGADVSFGQILGMAVAAGALWVLADALQKLSTIPETNLTNASIAISILGGLITGMETILGIANALGGNVSFGQILAMAVAAGAVWVLADAMARLAKIPEEDLLKAGIAMGAVVACLGIVIGLLALAGAASGLILTGTVTLVAVAAIVAIVVAIGGLLGGLVSLLPDGVKQGVLDGLDWLSQVSTKVGEVIGNFFGGIAEGATSKLPEIATAISKFMENLQGIKPIDLAGLAAFGEAVVMIAAIEFVGFFESIASFVREAQTGRSNTEQFGVDLQALAEGLQTWQSAMEEIDKIKIPTEGLAGLIVAVAAIDLVGFFEAIGDAWSTLLTGNSTMENFVENIRLLSKALTDWQTAMEGIDEVTVPSRGIRELNDIVFEINFAGFFEAIGDAWSELLTGNSTMENFVENLELLSGALTDWQTAMEGIDEINVPSEGINELVGVVSEINFEGFFGAVDIAVSNWLTNQTPMENFVQGIGQLAQGLSDWQAKMEEIKHITVPTDAISDLIQTMDKIGWSALGNAIKDWLTKLFGGEGEDSVTTFSEKLTELATALETWQTKMEAIGKVTVPKEAIDSLVESLEEMPKEGGLVKAVTSFFTGEENFDTFKTKVKELGDALQEFSNALGQDFNVDTASSASTIIQAVADLGEAFRGQKWQDTISTMLVNLGQGLIQFGRYLQAFTLTELDIEKLSSMATASDQLAHVAEVMAGFELTGDIVNEDAINQFKTGIETLKTSLGSLSDLDTSGVETLKQAATDLSTVDLKAATSNLGTVDTSGLSQGGKAAGDSVKSGLSQVNLSGAMSTVLGTAKQAIMGQTGTFNAQGKILAVALSNGISSGAGSAASAMSSVVSSAKSAIDTSGASARGLNFAEGFANGIRSGKYLAEAAAFAIGIAANKKLQQAINSKSPSKVTYKLGTYFGQGFTNGITDHIGATYRSGTAIGRAAVNGLHDAAKSIRGIIESDLDAQPVVRPVLDLSDIQSGAASIGDMLNTSPIGITGNLSAINSNVNNRNMTSNADVVSAISQLRRTLNNGNLGTHNTYNVNGVTYDDGSNVSNAVRSLVRATIVERRA